MYIVHGVVDLVRLPYHQYQEDGRIVWGLQRGATSFSTSTGVAVVELTSRTLETLQVCVCVCVWYDIQLYVHVYTLVLQLHVYN